MRGYEQNNKHELLGTRWSSGLLLFFKADTYIFVWVRILTSVFFLNLYTYIFYPYFVWVLTVVIPFLFQLTLPA